MNEERTALFPWEEATTEKVQSIMVILRVEVATFAGIRVAETGSGKCCHSSDFFSGFWEKAVSYL
ncbi:MAG: hypothetical protein EOM03_04995 [Clostridia bacterium]|nr:hypothetical protein [Clostridia bacterium]